MKKFTIRRHLSKGQYFGFFQVRGYITDSKQGEVLFYVNPETQNLVMQDCILHNKVNQSIKIFEGQNSRKGMNLHITFFLKTLIKVQ